MENNTPIPPNPVLENQPATNNRFTEFGPKKIGIFLGGILLASLILFYGLSQVTNRSNSGDDSGNTEKAINIAPYTVMYGSWSENKSLIFGYDLSTGKEDVIAELPKNIKKVTLINSNTLIYIAKADVRDHGDVIAKYDLNSKKETVLFEASDGYGIDDYSISANRQFVSTWEVQTNEESGVLLGGRSRVYTVDLTKPTVKNLIVDEAATLSNPVLYPRAILNNGTVFMDRFLPNSGAGWAYGMRVSNFAGTEQREIESMQNGTYSSQPMISPDESKFAFLGYDGSEGDGKALDSTGFRIGLIFSNTVEVFDTETLQRVKLANVPSTTLYSSLVWKNNSTLSFNGLLKNENNIREYYEYSIPQSDLHKLDKNTDQVYLGTFGEVDLFGIPNSDTTMVGNLGARYSNMYQSLSANKDQKLQKISYSPTLVQYIDTVSTDLVSIEKPKNLESMGVNQLQLQSFLIRPELDEPREDQQTDPPPLEEPTATPTPTNTPQGRGPRPIDNTPDTPKEEKPDNRPLCTNFAVPRCNAAMGRSYNEYIGVVYNGQLKNSDNEYHKCLTEELGHLTIQGNCKDSPLYLYGPEGLVVNVTIHTPIYNETPKSQEGSYSVTLGKNGLFTYKNSQYNSISYDYDAAIKRFPTLTKGYIVTKQNVDAVVGQIAKQFGFNEKETQDTVRDIRTNVTSPYAFISFYDHATSHAILPLTFSPKPDVYRNIVFYIKNLDQKPTYSVQAPKIEQINRHGFTAIEISHIVD